MISLRRRLVGLVGLATLSLLAASVAVWRLRAESTTARTQAAVETGTRAAWAIAQDLPDATRTSTAPWGLELAAQVQAIASREATRVGDGGAGLCDARGAIRVEFAARPPHQADLPRERLPPGPRRDGEAPREGRAGAPPIEVALRDRLGPGPDGRPHLLPLDRRAVEDACRAAPDTGPSAHRDRAPRDLLFITVVPISAELRAWALTKLPNAPDDGSGTTWTLLVAAMAIVALLLLLTSADTWNGLRKGVDSLEASVQRLEHELDAVIPEPRADELARIARALRHMAGNLSAAQRREQALQRRLASEQRLAGLGRVVAGVAHEVRNPLTGMKLKLDTMARRPLDERSRADVQVCLGEIARLDRLVSTLLVVGRKAPTVREAVSLGLLVDERIAAAPPLGDEPARITRRGEATVSANREALVRVVDNLLRNAVEAARTAGAPDVEVRVEDGPSVTLSVVDRGSGIPPEREAELFEPFFTTRPSGTGLGLFLSRSLVEVHGGTLSYERVDGETRFLVRLPREGSPG